MRRRGAVEPCSLCMQSLAPPTMNPRHVIGGVGLGMRCRVSCSSFLEAKEEPSLDDDVLGPGGDWTKMAMAPLAKWNTLKSRLLIDSSKELLRSSRVLWAAMMAHPSRL